MTALRDSLESAHEAAWGWALSCCRGDGEEAMELLQDSYAKVLGGAAVFGHRSRFETWLFGVIRRTAMEHRRRRALRLVGLDRYRRSAHPLPRPTPVDPVEHGERAATLTRCLNALSTRQREVLHLVFYQELTIEEAADAMGIGVGAARQHYHRGKRNLLALLDREGLTRET